MSFVKGQDHPRPSVYGTFQNTVVLRVGKKRPPEKVDLLEMCPKDNVVYDRVHLLQRKADLLEKLSSFQDILIFQNERNTNNRGDRPFIDQIQNLT